MANKILSAVVHPVKIGHREIEGLLLETVEYAISATQINQLISFSTSNNTISRDLKRLLGEGFSPSKCKIETSRQLINYVLLPDFELLLLETAIAGNKNSVELSRMLVGLSLRQLFADAFGEKFEQEDRQKFLRARQEGKQQRLMLTDGIKAYMEANGIQDGRKWYAGCTQNTYLALFGMTKPELLKSRGIVGDKTPRDFMSYEELQRLARFEHHAAILMIKRGMEPHDAVKEAREFFS